MQFPHQNFTPYCLFAQSVLSFLVQHPFCHLPSPVLLWLFEGSFGDSSLLVYTHTGYNAMSDGLHAKVYYQEDGLCAKVIRHLCVFGPLKDNEIICTIIGALLL